MPENPPVCLYHVTDKSKLPTIFTKGLRADAPWSCEDEMRQQAIEDGIDPDDDFDYDMYCDSPESNARSELDRELDRGAAVYFTKTGPLASDYVSKATIEVPAEKIPCKCIEGDYELENVVYDMIYGSYNPYGSEHFTEDEFYKAIADYKHTVRDLDNKENDYITEVICECDIPPEIIRPMDLGIGSCVLQKPKWRTLHEYMWYDKDKDAPVNR